MPRLRPYEIETWTDERLAMEYERTVKKHGACQMLADDFAHDAVTLHREISSRGDALKARVFGPSATADITTNSKRGD